MRMRLWQRRSVELTFDFNFTAINNIIAAVETNPHEAQIIYFGKHTDNNKNTTGAGYSGENAPDGGNTINNNKMGVYMQGTSLGVNLKVGRGIKGTQKGRGVKRKQHDPIERKAHVPAERKAHVPADLKQNPVQSAAVSAGHAKWGKGTFKCTHCTKVYFTKAAHTIRKLCTF